jgi:hypothetical protein
VAIRILHLICAACGAGVNKVEYDPAQSAARLASAAATLGVDPSVLAQHNVDSEGEALSLAQSLANPSDSPCPTPGCPGGEVRVAS